MITSENTLSSSAQNIQIPAIHKHISEFKNFLETPTGPVVMQKILLSTQCSQGGKVIGRNILRIPLFHRGKEPNVIMITIVIIRELHSQLRVGIVSIFTTLQICEAMRIEADRPHPFLLKCLPATQQQRSLWKT